MKKSILFIGICLLSLQNFAQAIYNTYQQEMNVAYQMYPDVPRGILEGWSFTTTHFAHLDETIPGSCFGLPRAYGVMGLTEDGQGYFKNSLEIVSELSGYSVSEMKMSPQSSILGFASAYHELLVQYNITSTNPKDHLPVLEALSEIPKDHNPANSFALNSHIYSVLSFINKPSNKVAYNIPNYPIDLETVFGTANYTVLSSSQVNYTTNSIVSMNGTTYVTPQTKSPDYAPALWVATPSCNRSSRSGTAVSSVTVHTIQGTYAGAISWAQNCSANVSYHYVVRSSDGQVTQMVLESQKAWHVGSANPYTIGIEHDGYVSDPSWYTNALYNGSAGISKDVTQSGYGISPLRTYFGVATSGLNTLGGCTKIKGHQHYPSQSHTDPGINWNWEKYYKLINDNPAINVITTASGTLFDSGGAGGNYSDDERTLDLIQPAGATNITITFNAFDLETDWDYMFVYDGATTDDALIGKYTGTTNPGTITSTGGSILIEFRSDCATNNPGWEIVWNSSISGGGGSTDVTAPTTSVAATGTWQTSDFSATFTDADNVGGSGVAKQLYQVIDFDGADWRANQSKGFFSDNFDQAAVHADWTSAVGTWALVNGYLKQSDETEGNTNLYASVNQANYTDWLYHFAINIDGANTNKRAGFHFMCDDATLPNRGNSYFAWFRTDQNAIQIYKVVNDVFSLMHDEPFTLNDNQWYDIKVGFSKTTGDIDVWVDNAFAATANDATPHTTGNAISFRSGNSIIQVNNLKVYHDRSNTETITIGATGDIRYQNPNSSTRAGRVKSIVIDTAKNVSAKDFLDINVDWTPASLVTGLNDGDTLAGNDTDNQTSNTQMLANWTASVDANSDIKRYWYAIGSTPGATDVVNWTDNWFNTSFVETGLSLNYGSTYYVTVKTENGAGLITSEVTSDGVTIDNPVNPPVANFTIYNASICAGDSIQLVNSSSDATTYAWTTSGGTLTSTTAASPYLKITTSGTYTVGLTATGPGGSDVTSQSISLSVTQAPVAAGTPSASTVLVNNIVTFTNGSSNANGYFWDFGDGNTSTDTNPWNTYTTTGTYSVMLVAINGTCPNDTTYITVEVTTSVAIDEIAGLSQTKIIPNPNTGNFDLVLYADSETKLEVMIYDVTGKFIGNVFNNAIAKGKTVININGRDLGISSGVYNLRIQTKNGTTNQRFIVQNN